MNSTEVYNALTHALITGRSEVLKTVGIQKTAGQMYEEFARKIGVATTALTFQQKQQAIAEGQDVVMEGRDITYRVLPEAQLKIFLTGSDIIRAKRRHLQLLTRGEDISYEDVLQGIKHHLQLRRIELLAAFAK